MVSWTHGQTDKQKERTHIKKVYKWLYAMAKKPDTYM